MKDREELPDYTGMALPNRGAPDVTFLLLVLLLTATGLVMLFSASYPTALQEGGPAASYFYRQLRFAVPGLLLMYVISRVDYHILKRYAKPLLLFSVVLLVLVTFKKIGVYHNGARRWLSFFGLFEFQPSEIAKLGVVVDFSASVAGKQNRMKSFRDGVWPYLWKLGIIGVLMMREPHLSGTILILCAGAAILFVGGLDWKWILLGIGVAALGIALMLLGVIPYGQDRIEVWRDPFALRYAGGFQVVQSILAIGSGGLTGVGLGNSRQKMLYLPEPENDFVFAIVCEELGLIGAALILALFALLVVKGYLIAMRARDRFGNLLVTGITTLLALQVFLNVGVVTGFLPDTGISLPFFSYGGTALIMQLAEMGIVLSVSRQCVYREDVEEEKKKTPASARRGLNKEE